MTPAFSQTEARDALDIYGVNFKLWPNRALAAYVQDNPMFADDIAAAAQLDAQLSFHDAPPASDILTARIMKAASQTPQASNRSDAQQPRARFMRIAAVFIASAVIAGTIGTHLLSGQSTDDLDISRIAEAETQALLIAANDLDMMDVFLWVETDSRQIDEGP